MWHNTRPVENRITLCWIYSRGEHLIDRCKSELDDTELLPQRLYEGYCLAIYSKGEWYLQDRTSLSDCQIDVLAWHELPAPYQKGVS